MFGNFVGANQRIQVEIPSYQQEAEYVWQTIVDIDFFEQKNYSVGLPQGPLIDDLLQKSRNKQLNNDDFVALKLYMRDHVYNESDYLPGKQAIVSKLSLLNDMITQIIAQDRNWHFKTFPKYMVRLTLYGPGGSYNPDDGSILIFTTKKGGFKQYSDPANTIIHEVVHIGIEHSIVQNFNVPHGLKERIVDIFVLLNFEHILPKYKKQPMGDEQLDRLLVEKGDLRNLAKVIETFWQNK